jgi:hypothetical protein
MTLVRAGMLALAASFVLSAGKVTSDTFLYKGIGSTPLEWDDVSGVSDVVVLPAGGGMLSFSIGTNLSFNNGPYNPPSYGNKLDMSVSNLEYICDPTVDSCDLNSDIEGIFSLKAGSYFTAFAESGTWSVAGPSGSMLTLTYNIGGAYSEFDQRKIDSPAHYKFSDGGVLGGITNSTYLSTLVRFTLGIQYSPPGNITTLPPVISPGGGPGNSTIPIIPLGNSTKSLLIDLPGKASFELLGAGNLRLTGSPASDPLFSDPTPEPASAMLLSGVMLLGFGARRLVTWRKHSCLPRRDSSRRPS